MMGANQMLQQGPMSMSFPGAAVGVGGPLPSGFVDPYSMAEFRDTGLFGTYSNDRYLNHFIDHVKAILLSFIDPCNDTSSCKVKISSGIFQDV